MKRSILSLPGVVPVLPWLYLLTFLVILAGYFGAWVPHRVAGLVITGLDLAEYVKFLPIVRSGQVIIWREGFYLPLVTVSLAASFVAFQPHFHGTPRVRWLLRLLLLTIATIAALNLLPPAWDQSTFTNPEFRRQIIALGAALLIMGTAPLWALLPRVLTAASVALLVVAALWFPLRDFFQVLPAIGELYQQPLLPGYGLYLTVAALLLLLLLHWIELCNLES